MTTPESLRAYDVKALRENNISLQGAGTQGLGLAFARHLVREPADQPTQRTEESDPETPGGDDDSDDMLGEEDEQRALAMRRVHARRSNVALSADPNAIPVFGQTSSATALGVSDQLRQKLKDRWGRVSQLLNDWDEDGDGEISRDEFVRGTRALGIILSDHEVEEVFSVYDVDGGGSIDYKELNRFLRSGNDQTLASSLYSLPAVGGDGHGRSGSHAHLARRRTRKSRRTSTHALGSSASARPEFGLFARGLGGSTFENASPTAAAATKAQPAGARGAGGGGGGGVGGAGRGGGRGGGGGGGIGGASASRAAGGGREEKPVYERLRDALASKSARVIDLFREWDDNGDGSLSQREFYLGIRRMGLADVPREEADRLFSSWDRDNSGARERARRMTP